VSSGACTLLLQEDGRELGQIKITKETANHGLHGDGIKPPRVKPSVGAALEGVANAALLLSGPCPGRPRPWRRQPGHWTAMSLARMGLRPPHAAGHGSTPR
jgi:hypothetical protein